MIKCVKCHKAVVIERDDRVYAIENNKIGSPVCDLVMGRPVSHLPNQFLYQEGTDNAKASR